MAPAPRRRASRGPACDDRPRLWGDEPAAAAPAVEPAPVVTGPAPSPGPVQAVAAPDETFAASAGTTAALVAPPQTLDDLIAGSWDGLVAGEAVACPVCATAMTPRWSAGAGVVGGRCGGCGTTLE